MAERAVLPPVVTRPWLAPLSVAVVAAAGCLYLQWQDPSAPDAMLPRCPTKMLTGLDCPLCGSLRCVRALTGGQWWAAVHDNLLLVLALPALAVVWVRWVAATAGLGTFQPRVSRRLTYVLVLVALGWMVLRNLPAWPLHPLG